MVHEAREEAKQTAVQLLYRSFDETSRTDDSFRRKHRHVCTYTLLCFFVLKIAVVNFSRFVYFFFRILFASRGEFLLFGEKNQLIYFLHNLVVRSLENTSAKLKFKTN